MHYFFLDRTDTATVLNVDVGGSRHQDIQPQARTNIVRSASMQMQPPPTFHPSSVCVVSV